MSGQLHFFSLVRHQYRICLNPWPHPWNRIETIDFDRLALQDEAKSKRVKREIGASYQAVRVGCTVTIKFFACGRLQRHMQMQFCARGWPKHEYDQIRFVEQLVTEMAKRVFDEEWDPIFRRQAEAIAKAVRQVLTAEAAHA